MSSHTQFPSSTQSHSNQSVPIKSNKPYSSCLCVSQHPNRRCIKHALVMFGRSFYIAYGLRSGLTLALHIIKILRSKSPGDIFSLRNIISANSTQLIDSVRIGLLFGGFSGIYHITQCILARIRNIHDSVNVLISGSIAGLSLFALDDASSRRTLSLYMFARVVQSWYNNQKKMNKFHFWGMK